MNFDEWHRAIKKGNVLLIRHAIEAGQLDPNLRNPHSWTLLMFAALEGNTSIGSLLIENGAELDTMNKSNWNALSLATHSGHSSFVRLLLNSGASLEDRPFGNTFDAWLDWACQYGRCTKKIRCLFDEERKTRAERDGGLDQLM